MKQITSAWLAFVFVSSFVIVFTIDLTQDYDIYACDNNVSGFPDSCDAYYKREQAKKSDHDTKRLIGVSLLVLLILTGLGVASAMEKTD